MVARGEGVFEGVREAAEDRRDVERRVFSPVAAAALHVLRVDQAGDVEPLAAEVRGVQGGDRDPVVERGLGVEGLVQLALVGERVAEEERLLGVQALEGFEVGLLDALGLRDHDEQIGRVEALQVVLGVGAEGDGEAVVVDDVLVGGELAGQASVGGGEGHAELVPENLLHLSGGGAGDDSLGVGAGVEPPEDGAGGGPVLARRVGGHDGDRGVAREAVEDGFLLVVRLASLLEDLFDESGGMVLVLGEHGPSSTHKGRAARPLFAGVWCGICDASMTDMRQSAQWAVVTGGESIHVDGQADAQTLSLALSRTSLPSPPQTGERPEGEGSRCCRPAARFPPARE